jgi:hypothetical protein
MRQSYTLMLTHRAMIQTQERACHEAHARVRPDIRGAPAGAGRLGRGDRAGRGRRVNGNPPEKEILFSYLPFGGSVAMAAGPLAAATALASGQDLEEALGELAEVMMRSGRDHHEMLQAELLPVAGSA